MEVTRVRVTRNYEMFDTVMLTHYLIDLQEECDISREYYHAVYAKQGIEIPKTVNINV